MFERPGILTVPGFRFYSAVEDVVEVEVEGRVGRLDGRLAQALMSIHAMKGPRPVKERSDVVALAAAGVVGEAIVTLVLADAVLQKSRDGKQFEAKLHQIWEAT